MANHQKISTALNCNNDFEECLQHLMNQFGKTMDDVIELLNQKQKNLISNRHTTNILSSQTQHQHTSLLNIVNTTSEISHIPGSMLFNESQMQNSYLHPQINNDSISAIRENIDEIILPLNGENKLPKDLTDIWNPTDFSLPIQPQLDKINHGHKSIDSSDFRMT